MNTPIRYPNITAKIEREQIEQIKRYLFQLVDQLNYALSRTEESSQNTEQGGSALSVPNTDT